MNSRVSSSILLLTSSVRFLSPYSKHSIRTLFGRVSIWTNDRNNSETPARKSRRCISNEGQSNKKCSTSSMPSFVGHIGFTVSLKLCKNLWSFARFFKEVYSLKQNAALKDERFDDRKNKSVLAL